jgi:large subunit ribosomal protein L15
MNLSTLEKLDAGSYDQAMLRRQGVLSSNRPVKLLGAGTLSKKFSLTIHATSTSAKKAVEKAGGSVTIARD